jgi:hypothetical protein
VHFAPWVGPAGLLEEIEEFGVAVVLIAGVVTLAGRYLPGGADSPARPRGQHDGGPASRHQQRVCAAGATAEATFNRA